MNILLSVKPVYAFRIFEGVKRYEFRKTIFKQSGVKKVIVYASAPLKMVIGEFEIEEILSADPETLWNRTEKYSGVSKEFFFAYFRDKESGYAIKIKNYKRYSEPLCIKDDFNISPPQSFRYLPHV